MEDREVGVVPAARRYDAVLADGSISTIRPATEADRARLQDLVTRLGERSTYLRYFSMDRHVHDWYVDRLLSGEGAEREALVAVVGDGIVGVGSWERLADPAEAEVALTVEDDQQGRGVGTLLLESLAAGARRRGVRRFLAPMMAENARALDVVRYVGLPVRRRQQGSMVQVELDLVDSATYRTLVDERERSAEVRSLQPLLRPRSVAVVGASRRAHAVGHEVLANLLRARFEGPVYPVNPQARTVAGIAAYPRVRDLPVPVDLAVIAVPAQQAVEVVRECGERGVRAAVVLSAGFAEAGAAGAGRQDELRQIARRAGMRLVGPNCLGVLNTDPAVRLDATISPTSPPPGRVGVVSQSGGVGVAVLEQATAAGLGLSSFVSLGNKADVSGNDVLLWWEDDDDTTVGVLYLESHGNPRRFARIARRVARRKPLVAVRAARSVSGAQAADAHTAAGVPPAAFVDALFRQAGIVTLDTLGELFEVIPLLVDQPLPRGPRLAIVTNAAGPGVLTADAAAAAGLTIPALDADTSRDLRAALPGGATVGNPVDTTAAGSGPEFAAALRLVLADRLIDAVVAVVTPLPLTEPTDLTLAVTGAAAEAARARKPLLAVLLGQNAAVRGLRAADVCVPAYAFPEAATRALGRAWAYADWQRRPLGRIPTLPGIDRPRGREIVESALRGDPEGGWLPPAAAGELLAAYGVPVSPPAVGAPGVQTLLGVVHDPTFGPVVRFGLAGVLAALLADRAFRLLPLTDVDAAELIRSVRAAPLLFGFAGTRAVDVPALENLVLRVAALAEDLPEVAELDLDPVLAAPQGVAVGAARVRVGPCPTGSDPSLRQLP